MKKISSTAVIHEGVFIEEDVVIHDYVVIYPNVVIKTGVEIFDHCVVGKPPKSPGCIAREISENLSETVIGENSMLSSGCIVYAGTVIGHNTLLGDHSSIREECSIGNFCVISRNVTVNYHTKIGDRTKILDNSHITGNTIIEQDVFISTLVATTNDNLMGRNGYHEEQIIGPYIKQGTTIGAAANILPNVVIGTNCIVGAGALVTKDIPDHKLVMGIPARVIRDVE